jgi:hypothetical protein
MTISYGQAPVGELSPRAFVDGRWVTASNSDDERGGITEDEVDTRGNDKSGLTDDVVRTAIRRVRASGVLELLDQWRKEDGYLHANGGRPPMFSAEAVIVGFLLLAGTRSPLLIRDLAKLLHHGLSDAMRAELGIPKPAPWLATKHHAALRWEENVRSTFRRQILDLMDPFPARRYESMTMVEVQRALEAHDKVNSAAKKARLDEFMRRFFHMTYMEQPRALRRASRRVDLTIDQTYIPPPTKLGFSRRELPKRVAEEQRALREGRALTRGPVDPFAGWHAKEGIRADVAPGSDDYSSPDNPGQATDYRWGWGVNIAERIDATVPAESRFPRIISAATLSLPGVGTSEEAVELMRSSLIDGNEPGVIDADMAYFANADPDRLHVPTRDLGFMPSTAYREPRIGQPRKQVKGVLMIDGDMYCPSTPEHLKSAVSDFRKERIDEATFQARRIERRHFRVHVKEQPNANGKMRVSCPALGAAPTVTCPIRELSAKASRNRDRPEVEAAPDILPDICRQHAITMDARENIRDQQAFEYMSPEWKKFHTHARQSIESVNAQLKSDTTLQLDKFARRPARGFAAAAFFVTMQLVQYNINKIAAFLHDQRVRAVYGAKTRDTRVARPRDARFYNPYTKTRPHGLGLPEYIERRQAAAASARTKRESSRGTRPSRT